MNISLAALRKKPHTSASALKTFLTCPRQYFFRYVERVTSAFRSASLSLWACVSCGGWSALDEVF